MSLLTGPIRKHLDGHKELTSHTELVKVEAGSLVYIPLINGNSTAVEVLVKEGDRVKVGTMIAKRNDHFTGSLLFICIRHSQRHPENDARWLAPG